MKSVYGTFLQAFFPVRQQVLTVGPGEYAAINVDKVTGINFVSEKVCEYSLIKTPTENAEADFLSAPGRMRCLGSLFGVHASIDGIVFKNPNAETISIFVEYME